MPVAAITLCNFPFYLNKTSTFSVQSHIIVHYIDNKAHHRRPQRYHRRRHVSSTEAPFPATLTSGCGFFFFYLFFFSFPPLATEYNCWCWRNLEYSAEIWDPHHGRNVIVNPHQHLTATYVLAGIYLHGHHTTSFRFSIFFTYNMLILCI